MFIILNGINLFIKGIFVMKTKFLAMGLGAIMATTVAFADQKEATTTTPSAPAAAMSGAATTTAPAGDASAPTTTTTTSGTGTVTQ